MREMIVQLAIVTIWGVMLGIHTRRLLRLAQVQTIDSLRNHPLRHRLNRVWWWLGREEFWRMVHLDCLRCVQLTLMIFLLAWGSMM
jgi:hypothetical protein